MRLFTASMVIIAFLVPLSSLAGDFAKTDRWTDYFSDNSNVATSPISVGPVIEALDPDSVLCGRFVVVQEGFYGFLHVYGDDPTTPDIDEGAVDGDLISFYVNGEFAGVTPPESSWRVGNPGGIFQVDLPSGGGVGVFPDSLDFGGVTERDSLDLNLIISNFGTEDRSLDSLVLLPSPFSIVSVSPAVPGVLPPGGSVTARIRFKPPDPGVFASVIRVHSGDPVSAVLDVELKGRGLVRFGDASHNNRVTAFDASLVLRHAVGSLFLAGRDSIAADVTGKGGISSLDAAYILRFVVGLIDRFPVEEGGVVKPLFWVKSIGLGESEKDGKSVSIPIIIDDMEGILGAEISVSLDGTAFRVLEVVKGDLGGEFLMESRVDDGNIKIAFAGPWSLEGRRVIAWITVEDQNDEHDISGISLSGARFNEGDIEVHLLLYEGMLPYEHRLFQNYPNPFNPQTTIRYDLTESGRVRLYVYNTDGQRIRTLIEENQGVGGHSVIWDGKDERGNKVASGVYIYRLVLGGFEASRKMILLR